MLKYRSRGESVDRVFHALADPTRRVIVERLSRGPTSVSELARPLPMSLPAVVQHLALETIDPAGAHTADLLRADSRRRCGRWSRGSAPGARAGSAGSTAWATTSPRATTSHR